MVTEETTATQLLQHSPNMTLSLPRRYQLYYDSLPVIPIFAALLLASSLTSLALSVSNVSQRPLASRTFQPGKELQEMKRIRAHLKKINKPAVKTIQSPDGDIIDCVKSHLQPAFDHPQLKGQKPLDPPEKPKGVNYADTTRERIFQLWRSSDELCPEGTIPIRRTTENDVLRSETIQSFGRKKLISARKDSVDLSHEHAVGFVNGKYNGAKASINVWEPYVANPDEFSLSQIWVISGSFGYDLNTIEVGWQVSPNLYGDNKTRFFTYWTSDAYQATGCYNLLCSGFVQINSKIAIGAAVSPHSSYEGEQFDIDLLVWKDPKHGDWWLQYGSGSNSSLVGYWPSFLFSHLRDSAGMIQFGGEIVNNGAMGIHTATQMGSGHFAGEGFEKSSYFRNIQVVDCDNNLISASGLQLYADNPDCYDIREGTNSEWGTLLYYGGPGKI